MGEVHYQDPNGPEEAYAVSPDHPLPTALGGAQTDAFGRVRVSDTGNRLDCEFIYDKQPDLFDELTLNGTATHNAVSGDVDLALDAAVAGNYAWMSSYPVPYTPGNSQLVDITGVLDFAAIGGGHAEVFLRSSVTGTTTEQIIKQDAWDKRRTGIDWTASHIFQMDFQSLKVGTIQFNEVTQGNAVNLTKIHNDNIMNTGYWRTPSLPAYYKVYIEDKGQGLGVQTFMEVGYGNTEQAIGFRYVLSGANASAMLKAICCTVKSEGGDALKDLVGFPRNIDTGTTTAAVNSATVITPIISIRSKALFNGINNLGLAIPDHFSLFTNNDIRVVVLLGGTLTGASWNDVNTTHSAVEYDLAASAVSGGRVLHSDFFAGASGNSNSSAESGLLGRSVLWNRLDGETGIITLAAVKLSSNATVRADIGWDEIR